MTQELPRGSSRDDAPLISVVIGFKDWGLDRLEFVIRSHQQCSIADRVEVIVSDYGSEDPEPVRTLSERMGVVCIRTETDGVWSRSRALNHGIVHARGRYIVTSDADIVYAPRTLELVVEELDRNPNEMCLVQCRDLTREHVEVIHAGFDWDFYAATSKLRPRWGMGGLAAFTQAAFYRVRGFDERMEIYGGEDNDFCKRMRAHGYPLRWLEHDDARIYHVWHEPSRKAKSDDEAAYEATMANREILLHDDSLVRNLSSLGGRTQSKVPYLSICIATHNRAEMLDACLRSVLAQTFEDFECIVVDDGSEDDTEAVVARFADPRVRYFKQAQAGVAAARNVATREARGYYIVVHDDDDVMLEDRLENHLKVLEPGDHGSYGGWVDFDTETGTVTPHGGKPFSFEALLFSGKVVLHPTLMISSELMRAFPYDESRSSGVDFDLLTRMSQSGLTLRHTGKFAILRRMHTSNLTLVDRGNQATSANMIRGIVRSGITASREREMRKVAQEAKEQALESVDLNAYRSYLGEAFSSGRVIFAPMPVQELGDLVDLVAKGFDLNVEQGNGSLCLDEVQLVLPEPVSYEAIDELGLPVDKGWNFVPASAEVSRLTGSRTVETPDGYVRLAIGPYGSLTAAAEATRALGDNRVSTKFVLCEAGEYTLITGTFPNRAVEQYETRLTELAVGGVHRFEERQVVS